MCYLKLPTLGIICSMAISNIPNLMYIFRTLKITFQILISRPPHCVYVLLRTKPKTSGVLGKHAITELYLHLPSSFKTRSSYVPQAGFRFTVYQSWH